MADDLEGMLHDEIDELERQRETVRVKIAQIKKSLVPVANRVESLPEIFEAAALLFENDIADDTTNAVKSGYALTKRQQHGGRGKADKGQEG